MRNEGQAFDAAAGDYRKKALVQWQAAIKLMDLLRIGGREAIIDIACGPGHITNVLSGSTRGRVMGIDVSAGMIEKARNLYPGLEFLQLAVEELNFSDQFDAAFCNSGLQWFAHPDQAMQSIYSCLKPRGKLGLACPATRDWSPWLSAMLSGAPSQPSIGRWFQHWKSPWFFLPSEGDYQKFFEGHGFITVHIELANERHDYSVQDAYGVYLSGAANGLLGPQYYDVEISPAYVEAFNSWIRESIEKSAQDGRVTVEFNRLYYLGRKHPRWSGGRNYPAGGNRLGP